MAIKTQANFKTKLSKIETQKLSNLKTEQILNKAEHLYLKSWIRSEEIMKRKKTKQLFEKFSFDLT